jgi:hypothetical protein
VAGDFRSRRALPTIDPSTEGCNVGRDKEGMHCFVDIETRKLGGDTPKLLMK